MAALGLLLLLGVAVALVTTGLPAHVVLVGASVIGALAAVIGGVGSFDVFAALPSRLIGLLDNDLLQAIPLYVAMGALIDRLPIVDSVFVTLMAALPGRHDNRPLVAALALGALMGPMNGSVGASVVALTRTLAPRLKASGIDPATRQTLIAVASTLGVVVPPSLVLILLGDAMLSAHTAALNATGRFDLIVNNRDIFRAALLPAGLFLTAAIVVALVLGRRRAAVDTVASPPSRRDVAVTVTALTFLVALLGGVATGRFYAVEAAAMGALVLFVAAAVGGRLRGGELPRLLDETLATTGVLFALLAAATTFTLVLRVLGTDRLVGSWLEHLPGGPTGIAAAGLAIIGLSAFVLDAFEIIFVIVPIVAPAILVHVEDAAWVSVLILLTLELSFLTPPIGYALMLSRSLMPDAPPLRWTLRRLAPFLVAQAAVLGLVFAFPGLTHPERIFAGATVPVAPRGPATTGGDIPFPEFPATPDFSGIGPAGGDPSHPR
ncbi:TRAP transporter large permease subunit [Siculibacillus lacustris]|uniref:TRAP transporter large permease subunit n=1 Tax=Siculibacillus lacustris TaxID=1549641 RepID=A0A4V2KTW9_9HYPH|nr:TRAP transporter large permease subunit [Siculibacillus lacustris]TBW39010.1 TRAP transporter large permease subunit [Siculibacillus lacustris]